MKHTSLAAALAAALFSAPLPAAAEELEPIRIIQSTSSAAFMPYLTALTMGYFEEAGLEPELITTSSGSKVAAAVAGGSADIGMTAASTSLFLRNEGVDIRLLAPLANQYTTGIVFSEKWAADRGITRESPLEDKLAALKGARLATPGGSAGEHILRYLAIKAGLDADREMVIVPMGSDIGTYQTALEQGQIDGISTAIPRRRRKWSRPSKWPHRPCMTTRPRPRSATRSANAISTRSSPISLPISGNRPVSMPRNRCRSNGPTSRR